jgi:hypothetical protein
MQHRLLGWSLSISKDEVLDNSVDARGCATFVVFMPLLPCLPCFVLQELLDTPNDKSPAQSEAYVCFTQRLNDYRKQVRKQSLQYPPPN